MHILGQKEAIWNTIFSIFERWRPPKCRGPGKTPPPLNGPGLNLEYLHKIGQLNKNWSVCVVCVCVIIVDVLPLESVMFVVV